MFEYKIPKITFVTHCKISLENLTIKSYDWSYHQKVEKSRKTLISKVWLHYLDQVGQIGLIFWLTFFILFQKNPVHNKNENYLILLQHSIKIQFINSLNAKIRHFITKKKIFITTQKKKLLRSFFSIVIFYVSDNYSFSVPEVVLLGTFRHF